VPRSLRILIAAAAVSLLTVGCAAHLSMTNPDPPPTADGPGAIVVAPSTPRSTSPAPAYYTETRTTAEAVERGEQRQAERNAARAERQAERDRERAERERASMAYSYPRTAGSASNDVYLDRIVVFPRYRTQTYITPAQYERVAERRAQANGYRNTPQPQGVVVPGRAGFTPPQGQ